MATKIEDWRNSRAKEHLKSCLQSKDENWINKIVAEEGVNAKSIEKIRNGHELFRQYDKRKFLTNFKNLKSSIENGTAEKKKKVEDWRNSKAKKYLKYHLEADEQNWIKMIIAKEGVNANSIEKIRNGNELFLQYKKENFCTNFKNLKAAVEKEAIAVLFDQKAYEKESKKYGDNYMLQRGYPKWDHPENKAKELLKADLKDHDENMTINQLRESRPEFAAYPKKTFRDRVYREKRAMKETPYWQHKRNKKMRERTVMEEIEMESLESALNSLTIKEVSMTDSDHPKIANV